MKIKDFTIPEIQYLRENCNFTLLEHEVFELRLKEHTLDMISEELHISRDWTGKLSQRVNRKIIRVI